MGYLGLVGGSDPCSEGALSPVLFTPVSGAMRAISFQDTPYGFALSFVGAGSLTPYLIDATTLEITVGAPTSGPYSGSAGDIQGALVFDDSTMVFGHAVFAAGHFTSDLHAITRSGLSVAVSGAQQSRATQAPPVLCRIDSSHLVRVFNPVPNTGQVIEVLSVSGGAISLVHTETISGVQHATVDPSGLPSTMVNSVLPFHYNGAGTLYGFGSATGGSPTLFGPAILAVPFSIGGGIGGAITLTTRAKDAQNVSGVKLAAKIGSSECVLLSAPTGYMIGFYDDGANMHFDSSGASSDWVSFGHINHNNGDADTETTQGNYLTNNVDELPQGNVVNSGPALVTQSGQTFGYSLITPQFLCAQFGTAISGSRHGSNLGAQIIGSPFNPGEFLLRAYKW